MFNFESATRLLWKQAGHALAALLAALLLSPVVAYAADTQCAKVKIEIQQELTMERQGFDAMRWVIWSKQDDPVVQVIGEEITDKTIKDILKHRKSLGTNNQNEIK